MGISTILSFLAAPFMLARENPQGAAKPKPHVVNDLIAWLETKDPHGHYYWFSPKHPCLLAQYGMARGLGLDNQEGPYFAVLRAFGEKGEGGCGFMEPGGIAMVAPHTYGEALERARKYKLKNRL